MLHNRIEVMHGVNLDQLGRREPGALRSAHAAPSSSSGSRWTRPSSGSSARFFQTNHEGDFVEHLHRLDGVADAVILNPGAWTHYAYAIRDALELAAPAGGRGPPLGRRRTASRSGGTSVLGDLCIGRVTGKGPDGYREALELLHEELRP